MVNLREIYDNDPFLSPNWRAERVAELLRFTPPRRPDRFDDKWIQDFRKFRIALRHPNPAERRNVMFLQPELYYANKIYERKATEPNVAHILEARLLTGASYETIAKTLKTYPRTVAWYERLFFNIGSRLSHSDWVLHSILLPAFDRHIEHDGPEHVERARVTSIAIPHLDMSLKFFAYFGGPLVCDMMVNGFQRNHVKKVDELADYFNDQFAMQIKRRSAQAATQFEINKYNVMELFTVHTRLIEIQRSGLNAEDKHTEFEKNINALMNEFPWSVGRAGAQLYDGKLVGDYDQTAVEPDADELLNAGANIPVIELEHDASVDVFAQRELNTHASTK